MKVIEYMKILWNHSVLYLLMTEILWYPSVFYLYDIYFFRNPLVLSLCNDSTCSYFGTPLFITYAMAKVTLEPLGTFSV